MDSVDNNPEGEQHKQWGTFEFYSPCISLAHSNTQLGLFDVNESFITSSFTQNRK